MASLEEESEHIEQFRISRDDCQKFARWGLGRGINITKKTPWVEKTPFQVRNVKQGDLIETDDGELLKAYSEEIRSRTTVKSEVQSGIRTGNLPVSVRMDAEFTRSTLSSKYVAGTKIKKRTISFRMEFSDVPQSLVKNVGEAIKEAQQKAKPSLQKLGRAATWSKSLADKPTEHEHPPLLAAKSTFQLGTEPDEHAATGAAPTLEPSHESISERAPLSCESVLEEVVLMSEGKSFEERLGAWIRNSLKRRGYHCPSYKNIQELILSQSLVEETRPKIEEVIQSFLDHFVQEFGVTHYLSAMELGAMEYRELTSKEFYSRAKFVSKASFGTPYVGADASTSQFFSKSKRDTTSEKKKIGSMIREKGKREKVVEEAVIGCSFSPISFLIKMPFLQHALKTSVDKYVRQESRGMCAEFLG